MRPVTNESEVDTPEASIGKPVVLFVDDDRDVQSAASLLLRRAGIALVAAHDTEEALSHIAARKPDLILLDLNYRRGETTGAEGLALLAEIMRLCPDMPVIVVTGHSGVSIAVAAMRAGACDFVMKPWNNNRFVACISRALSLRQSHASPQSDVFVASSPAMTDLVAQIERLASTRASLVISGAAGSGKMSLARRFASLACRHESPVILNGGTLAALPAGAGLWIISNIEDLSLSLQGELVERLDRHDAPQIVALTSLDPVTLDGRLDPGLAIILGVIHLVIPPLRDRLEDVRALTQHFLRYFILRHGLPGPQDREAGLDPDRLLDLPHEVRGLRAAVERAVLTGTWPQPSSRGTLVSGEPVKGTLRDTEHALVEAALRKHGFNVTKAAQELGLTRPALYRRMARFGL